MSLFQPPTLCAPSTRSESSRPVPAAAVLSSIGITKRKIKKLDAIARAREPHRSQARAYSGRPFALCGIPVRRPAKSSLEYSRQNGKFRLRVIGHPDYGLPFGQDRLLLIWIASMATSQKNRTIRFCSAAMILETFGLAKDGRYYKRLIAGFERIFYSTFYFASDERHAEAVVITRTSFRFVKDGRLWYIKEEGADQEPDSVRRENVIVLSEEFWREIQEHPIPVDLNVVKALADSPGNLDLYVWLAWRCWTAKGPVSIPLFGAEGLISQLGISDRLRERDFRRQIVRRLKNIHQLWPDCPATTGQTGTVLLIRSSNRTKHAQ
ncbi:MAG: replication protein RepA [Terriglobia bacterium]